MTLAPEEGVSLYQVLVGWTSSRPVRPDEHEHILTLWATDDIDAVLSAALWVGARKKCEMVTRMTILTVEV